MLKEHYEFRFQFSPLPNSKEDMLSGWGGMLIFRIYLFSIMDPFRFDEELRSQRQPAPWGWCWRSGKIDDSLNKEITCIYPEFLASLKIIQDFSWKQTWLPCTYVECHQTNMAAMAVKIPWDEHKTRRCRSAYAIIVPSFFIKPSLRRVVSDR